MTNGGNYSARTFSEDHDWEIPSVVFNGSDGVDLSNTQKCLGGPPADLALRGEVPAVVSRE